MCAFDDLMAHTRDTVALGEVLGRLGWDQETMMPRGAAEQRAEEMAALESVLHARRTDPRIGDWLAAVEPCDAVATAQLRHIARSYARNVKVPERLARALASTTSRAQGIWAEARSRDDFAGFAPTLKEVVALRREEAACLAKGDHPGALYDALLEDYEPGTSATQITAMFDALRPGLVALRDKVLGADEPAGLSGRFDEAAQMALAEELARAFGYDMATGRIDKAVHPFSSGSGRDVRITTRTDPADPFNCFYSTIHEVGHATYEQGIEAAYGLTPLGAGVSMGVHESQSRIYENQLGRSVAFTGWLHGRMTERFGDIGVGSPEAFARAVNRVKPGYIRTEADEVHYNLHVMLRYDLERDLIGGALEVDDLPEAWNARFEADFGIAVDRPSNGVLQDVHWSVGLFGYFPTYSLGNVYAGCLNAALRADVLDLDLHLAQGDPGPALAWLREKVQRHGGLYEPVDLITRATGQAPGVQPLLDYLDAKFSALYNL
jgi:carboxypeptidase Taq